MELLRLSDFMCHVFASTEETRRILTFECDEAKFALAPWPVENIVTRQIARDTCTCDNKLSSEDQVEEIAAGIGRALFHAQQLREKLFLNISKEKKQSREPDLCAIYTATSKKTSIAKEKATKLVAKVDDVRKKPPMILKPRIPDERKLVKPGTSNDTRNDPAPAEKECNKMSAMQKAPTASARSKAKRNFLLENKLRVKSTNRGDGSGMTKSNSNTKPSDVVKEENRPSNFRRKSTATSTSEIRQLIEQVSLESTKTLSTSGPSIKERNCPLHDNFASQFIQEKVLTTVDVIEGLDRYGVPEQIINASKIFHAYLNENFAVETRSDKKTRKALNNFLTEFNKMNENSNNQLLQDNPAAGLATEAIEIFTKSYKKDMDEPSVNDIQKRFAAFDHIYKIHNIQAYESNETQEPKISEPLSTLNSNGWSSNGIWNDLSIPYFKEMSKVCCMRYSNKNQLRKFFDATQKLQRTQYLEALIDLIQRTLIPEVLRIDPTGKDYVHAYKMIAILIQGLNPIIPVLVRLDD